MIMLDAFGLATSSSTHLASGMPALAKALAPLVQDTIQLLRSENEWCLHVSTIAVGVGVALEGPEIFHEFRTKFGPFKIHPEEMPRWFSFLGCVGWLLIVIGIAGEFYFEGAVSTRSEQLESLSNDLLRDAQILSAQATKQAGTANDSAADAATAADQAERSADAALVAASKSDALARGALQREVNEEAELQQIKTPRSLTNPSDFVAELKKFKGTEYTFSSVFSDEESINLLREIDSALQLAGWNRVKPPTGFPSIMVYGKDVDFPVVSSLQTGLLIVINSPETLPALMAVPDDRKPEYIKAAGTLSLTLSSHLSPPQVRVISVDVEPGTSSTVQIIIGKKP
jgi:hypothetical protein